MLLNTKALRKAADLESLAYTLISFFRHRGNLPWYGAAVTHDFLGEIEMFDVILEPTIHADFLAYFQDLKRDEEPDYDKFIHLFQTSQ